MQLVSGGPGDYAYNADGQRVLKTIAGTQTRLVWDGEGYLMELDGSNVTSAVYTVAPSAFGMLIAQRRKSGAVWTPSHYLFDALGSTDRLLSSAQAVTDSYVYRAFGELAAATGSTTNPFRWVGELGYYYDPVGTQSDYYVRARWYKSALAKWLSRDPLWASAVHEIVYQYASNNPIVYTDSTGMKLDDAEKKAIAGCKLGCRPGPKDNPGSGGWTECKGGKPVVKLPAPKDAPEIDKLGNCFTLCGISGCITEHEKHHIEQYNELDPNVCKGQADGAIIGPANEKCGNTMECYGWDNQFKCMDKKLTQFQKKDVPCKYGDGRKVGCKSIIEGMTSAEARNAVNKKYNCKDNIGKEL